jgi:hypothetical protein
MTTKKKPMNIIKEAIILLFPCSSFNKKIPNITPNTILNCLKETI